MSNFQNTFLIIYLCQVFEGRVVIECQDIEIFEIIIFVEMCTELKYARSARALLMQLVYIFFHLS